MKNKLVYLLSLLPCLMVLACSAKKEEPAAVKPESKEAPAVVVDTKFASMENPEPKAYGEGCGDVFSKEDMKKELAEGNPYGAPESYISIGLDAKHTFSMNLMNFNGKLGLMIMIVHDAEVCVKGKEEKADAAIKFTDGSLFKLKAVNSANCGTAESVTDSTGAVAIFEIPMNSTFFKKALTEDIPYIAAETNDSILITKLASTDSRAKLRNGLRCAFDAFDGKPNLDDDSKLIDNRVVLKKDKEN